MKKEKHIVELLEGSQVKHIGGFLVFEIVYRGFPFKVFMNIHNSRTFVDEQLLQVLYDNNDINNDTFYGLYENNFLFYDDCVSAIKKYINKQYEEGFSICAQEYI